MLRLGLLSAAPGENRKDPFADHEATRPRYALPYSGPVTKTIVLVAREPGDGPIRHILIAVDESEPALDALAMTARLALAHQCAVIPWMFQPVQLILSKTTISMGDHHQG